MDRVIPAVERLGLAAEFVLGFIRKKEVSDGHVTCPDAKKEPLASAIIISYDSESLTYHIRYYRTIL